MIDRLTHTASLWIFFLSTLLLSFGFAYYSPAAGGVLLDTISSADEVRELLAAMSVDQKRAHIWITLLLDMPFPLAYGGLFAAIAVRYGAKAGLWLALPACLVIAVDVLENMLQILMLNGNEGLAGLKPFVTPLKFGLFYLAASIALLTFLLAMVRSFLNRGS